MFKKSLLISALAIVAIAFTSCTKEGPEGPAGKDATLKGSIIGYVKLYDEFGKEITDKSGVNVTIDGASPAVTATTDATGKFTVNNLPTGTYDIIVSKTGYATDKSMGFPFVGGVKPIYENYNLSQISNTVVSELDTLLKEEWGNVRTYLTYKLTNPNAVNKKVRFRLFMSTDPNVSSTNYILNTTYGVDKVGNGESSFYVNYDEFPVGTKIYMVAYGESENYSTLYDYATGKHTYITLNATKSNVISYTRPADNK